MVVDRGDTHPCVEGTDQDDDPGQVDGAPDEQRFREVEAEQIPIGIREEVDGGPSRA